MQQRVDGLRRDLSVSEGLLGGGAGGGLGRAGGRHHWAGMAAVGVGQDHGHAPTVDRAKRRSEGSSSLSEVGEALGLRGPGLG